MNPRERNTNNPEQKIIRERIDPRAIDALMSTYRDAQTAVLDLVDNSVDNRIEGKPQIIRVRIVKDELSIINQGGYGLDFEGLNNYFVWGHSEKTEGKIGKFGVGGKAAMGFLGRGMEITCSADSSDVEYKVSDTSWESRQGELKQYSPEEKTAFAQEGYFRVKITDLKREINTKALTSKLADTYRPLLLDGSIKITVNGVNVEPAQIRYIEEEGISPQTLKVETRFGDWFNLRVGILADSQKVKPGIRCYYNGRLIEEEQFFGHPTPAQMSGSSRLFGEADLDFVPVTTNKSDFDKSSIQWEMASKRIYTILTPIMEKLATLKGETNKIERYERELAKDAKRILEHVLATTQLITKSNVPGGAEGRMPPNQRDRIVEPVANPTGPHKPKEGETAPRLPAKGKDKRWGAGHEFEITSMGNTTKRMDAVEEKGKLIIKINSDYPLYQAAKKISPDSLSLYQLETFAMEFARLSSKERSVEEYNELVDRLLEDAGQILRNRVKPVRPVKNR